MGTVKRLGFHEEYAPAWYTGGLPKKTIKSMVDALQQIGNHGDFIVRVLEKHPDGFGLSIKSIKSENLGNFLILLSPLPHNPDVKGYKLKKATNDKVFPTLSELIIYYSQDTRKDLGIKLRLPEDGDERNASPQDQEETSFSGASSTPRIAETAQEVYTMSPGMSLLDYIEQSDPLTAMAEWFVGGHEREEIKVMVQNLLQHGEVGDFVVRDLSSESDGFGLALKAQSGLRNFKIEKLQDGGERVKFKLRGTTDNEVFDTISSLIYHYATTKDGVAGTKLHLRQEDLAQFAKAIKSDGKSFGIDEFTTNATWFVSGTDRNELKAKLAHMLKHGTIGQFIIRDVVSDPGNFGMSVKMPQGRLPNYLIERIRGSDGTPDLFQLRGSGPREMFPSLALMVYYYATSPVGVMGQQLHLPGADKAALRAFLQANFAKDFDALELIRSGAPENTDSAKAPPTQRTVASEGADVVTPLVNTLQAARDTMRSGEDIVGSKSVLVLYSLTFKMTQTIVAPPPNADVSLSVALFGTRGSTAMRPIPAKDVPRMFVPGATVLTNVVMEDVGDIWKVGLGVNSATHGVNGLRWSVREISVTDSVGKTWSAECSLDFSSHNGYYQECSSTSTAAAQSDGSTQPVLPIHDGQYPDVYMSARNLKLVQAAKDQYALATNISSGALQKQQMESYRLRSQLGAQQLRAQQLESRDKQSKQQVNEPCKVSALSQRMQSLMKSLTATKGGIDRDQQHIKELERAITNTRASVKEESRKLQKTQDSFEQAKNAAIEDKGVLRSLKQEYTRLVSTLQTEEQRLNQLVVEKEKAYRDVATYRNAISATRTRLRDVNDDLGNTAKSIRALHATEEKLKVAIVRDERRLQRLQAMLRTTRAKEHEAHLHTTHAEAVARARERARVGREQRRTARESKHAELSQRDLSDVKLPENFYDPFGDTYDGPWGDASDVGDASPITDEVQPRADNIAATEEEQEAYGFSSDDDNAVASTASPSPVVPAVAAAVDTTTPRKRGVRFSAPVQDDEDVLNKASGRFEKIKSMWGLVAGNKMTLARRARSNLDSQLHEVDGAVVERTSTTP
eukprot:m.781511 g.781511  ORF g.781511 m.781511 type:complete len:1077 (+) comp23286_c0_seq4:353-3583(+)